MEMHMFVFGKMCQDPSNKVNKQHIRYFRLYKNLKQLKYYHFKSN